MARFFKIVFLSFLPALIALAHDFYLFKSGKLGDQDGFFMSDLGWIWELYSKGTHDQVMDVVPAAVWNGAVSPLLSEPAAIVCAVPAAVLSFIFLILFVFGIGPFSDEGLLEKYKQHRMNTYKQKEARLKMKMAQEAKEGKPAKKGKSKEAPQPAKSSNEVGLDDVPVKRSDKW
jgi:hypothetical protein